MLRATEVKTRTLKSRPRREILADCISSADKLITLQCEKVELLKQHKKGLEQLLEAEGRDDN
jgi:hypothetical protein